MADIASDLQKVEATFVDADTRLKEAWRDRDAALEAINTHQMEFDQAIADLRQKSIPGSRWNPEDGESEDGFMLRGEAASQGPGAKFVNPDASPVAFQRARMPKQVEDDSPIVKVKL